MRVCRFETNEGRQAHGLIEGDEVAALEEMPFAAPGIPRPLHERLPLSQVRLLAPALPSKIVGVGLNYRAHAEEMRKPLPAQPLIFLKPPSALLDPERAIALPPESGEVHFESELALVIGRETRRVTPREARACIFGYTCFNDVTARDIQRAETQYTRAKGFDTFAPFGPWIETELDPTHLSIEGRLDGTVRQRGNTSDMIFDVFELVSFISRGMTLMPGDVITTGTPPGVGPLAPGNLFEVEVEGIGCLRNRVEREVLTSPRHD